MAERSATTYQVVHQFVIARYSPRNAISLRIDLMVTRLTDLTIIKDSSDDSKSYSSKFPYPGFTATEGIARRKQGGGTVSERKAECFLALW